MEGSSVKINFKNDGFTLLELLTTLGVASLIVTLGVPSFRAVLDNQRMTAGTNELVTSLNLAKSEAIKRVAYVTVCKSDNGSSCGGGGVSWNDGWLVFANSTSVNLGTVDANDTIIRVYSGLKGEMAVAPTGTVDGFLSFRPSGTMGTTASNTSGSLTFCDRRGVDDARAILLEPSGRWRVSHDEDHNGNALSCS
jgi:type IV fimbrial biogenesis protein FimT